MLLSGLGRDSPAESVLFNAGNFKVDSPTQLSPCQWRVETESGLLNNGETLSGVGARGQVGERERDGTGAVDFELEARGFALLRSYSTTWNLRPG